MEIQKNVSLAGYTTLHIGGPAEYFSDVTDVEELQSAVSWAKERALPLTILGGGSNVFAADEGVRGLVAHIAIRGMEVEEDGDGVLLTLGAGEIFDEVVAYAVSQGWWGLENLSCIPGSVGASPIQNIGAYGAEIKEVIASVDAYDRERDESVTLLPAACAFAYRDSIFKHEAGKRYIITRVSYRLSKQPRPNLTYADVAAWDEARRARSRARGGPALADIRAAVCTIRAKKFPDWKVVGTAGSFFQNPVISRAHFEQLRERYPALPGYPAGGGFVKVPLGWILDRILGLRGARDGAVGAYEGQALVLVNHGGASARELELFAEHIAKNVFDATAISVEWEVTKFS